MCSSTAQSGRGGGAGARRARAAGLRLGTARLGLARHGAARRGAARLGTAAVSALGSSPSAAPTCGKLLALAPPGGAPARAEHPARSGGAGGSPRPFSSLLFLFLPFHSLPLPLRSRDNGGGPCRSPERGACPPPLPAPRRRRGAARPVWPHSKLRPRGRAGMRCPQPPVAVSRPRRGRARAVQGLRAGVGGAARARPLRNLRFWGEPLRVPAEQDAKRGDSAGV